MLHHIYLSHRLRDYNFTFVSGMIVSLFRTYTGHASTVIWLVSPQKFIPMLWLVPQMWQLSKLLSCLPPLFLWHDWPTKSLTLPPLDTVLWRPLAPNPSIKAKWNLPVADIVHYYPDRSILLRRPKSEISNKCIIPYAKAWAHSQIQLFLFFCIISILI
jgi:hypothetical protein